jgi:hypothetical protein
VRDSTDPLQLVLALDVPASYFSMLPMIVFTWVEEHGYPRALPIGGAHANR